MIFAACLAVGNGAAAAIAGTNYSHAARRRRQLDKVLGKLRQGQVSCGEITDVDHGTVTLGAPCHYEITFPGNDGLDRKARFNLPIDIDNRYEVGTPAMLRVLPELIAPLLRSLDVPPMQMKGLPAQTQLPCPVDSSGRVLFETDYQNVETALANQHKYCLRQAMFYGIAAAIAGVAAGFWSLMVFGSLL